jgi:hypothetical protein
VAAIGFLHGINRQEANRVDRQLIQLRRIERGHSGIGEVLIVSFSLADDRKTCGCATQKNYARFRSEVPCLNPSHDSPYPCHSARGEPPVILAVARDAFSGD